MSSSVTTIRPHLIAIDCPDVLRALPGWLCWRLEEHEGEAKPRKVPYYANGARRHGVQGRPEDRQQLVTFDAAKAAAARRNMYGVGFCPMPEWGIVALDFDRCVGTPADAEVERLVAGTYSEYSPSGTGVRAFVRGNLGNRKNHGEPYGFETFSSKGFVTFSGNRTPICELTDAGNTVLDAGPEVLQLCELRFGRAEAPEAPASASSTAPLGLTPEQLREALDVLPLDLDYDAWLSTGMALHHETGGSDEGFELWDEKFSPSSKYSSREYGLYKWESFGRGGQRPTTAHYLLKLATEHGAHIDTAQLAADDFDAMPEAPASSTPAKQRFPVIPAAVFADGKPPGWIIKDVLPRADLIVLFGESGSGKTFIALDLAAAIARGINWRGYRTTRGRVVYIAAEGAGGLRTRLKAYAARHGLQLADLDLAVIAAAPNLLLKDDALDVCKSIIAAGRADLIVVDTFAQVTPGANENAAEDVGRALAHCRGIRVATGAPVLLVHHAGKDQSKGARGWSGLKAAADAELEVLRTPGGRMVRLSKQKDGRDGLEWGFDLEPVAVGVDEDGDEISSCVVCEAPLPAIQQVGALMRDLGPASRLVLIAVSEMAEAQTAGIEVAAVVAEVARRLPEPENGKRDTRKQRAKQALETLCRRDDSPYLIEDDGTLTIL